MNYIKIDHSHFEEDMKNYIYFLELDNNNMVKRQIITNINKDRQEINKLVYGDASGLFKWKNCRFDNIEVEKNKISKEEFDKYWHYR